MLNINIICFFFFIVTLLILFETIVVATVVARNAVEGQTYDGFDWTELPEHILEAAITLGYNQS